MKKIILSSLLVASTLILSGCGGDSGLSLSNVVKHRYSIKKGMTKEQVQNILKTEPDEISQVGNYELWIYKGIVEKGDNKAFNDFVVKFVDGKVAYTGFFKCNLPEIEE
jgi:hypothetical protein